MIFRAIIHSLRWYNLRLRGFAVLVLRRISPSSLLVSSLLSLFVLVAQALLYFPVRQVISTYFTGHLPLALTVFLCFVYLVGFLGLCLLHKMIWSFGQSRLSSKNLWKYSGHILLDQGPLKAPAKIADAYIRQIISLVAARQGHLSPIQQPDQSFARLVQDLKTHTLPPLTTLSPKDLAPLISSPHKHLRLEGIALAPYFAKSKVNKVELCYPKNSKLSRLHRPFILFTCLICLRLSPTKISPLP